MLLTIALAMSMYVLVVTSSSQASALGLTTNGISLTYTSTTSLSTAGAGPVSIQVSINSVNLAQSPPQAYAFGVSAQTSSGLTITKLIWQFGDGSSTDVIYCCQTQVSEVQYHAYSQPGMYTVKVFAVDNIGNMGYAQVLVNWSTPIS